MFKGSARFLRFAPADGMEVEVHGRISAYEPRGVYQIICDIMQVRGEGALQAAFEALKKKLEAEGLFSPERKKPLPVFPRRIGLVTSPTGAAVQDFHKTARSRFSGADILLAPVRVQGDGAAREIAEALHLLARVDGVEVIALVRGGGSLEDLWQFNEEVVVRAIAASRVPVVTGIGHETDYTLSDFAADARALTPTDAARLCVPDADELRDSVAGLIEAAGTGLLHALTERRLAAVKLAARLDRSRDIVDEAWQRVEEAAGALNAAAVARIAGVRASITALVARAASRHPRTVVSVSRERCRNMSKRLGLSMRSGLDAKRGALSDRARLLHSLSPLAVLDRGYSLTFDARGAVVRDASTLSPGDELRLKFSRGGAAAEVKRTGPDPAK
jgi:exodeoxyribonuclease VII large subunit